MAKYLLDTNICIYIQKKKPFSVFRQFAHHDKKDIAISAITLGELYYGASFSQYPLKNREKLQQFLDIITVLPLPESASYHYGQIYATLRKQGKLIGNNDMWIASHGLAENMTVVTNNVKEFARVEGLSVINWLDESSANI